MNKIKVSSIHEKPLMKAAVQRTDCLLKSNVGGKAILGVVTTDAVLWNFTVLTSWIEEWGSGSTQVWVLHLQTSNCVRETWCIVFFLEGLVHLEIMHKIVTFGKSKAFVRVGYSQLVWITQSQVRTLVSLSKEKNILKINLIITMTINNPVLAFCTGLQPGWVPGLYNSHSHLHIRPFISL